VADAAPSTGTPVRPAYWDVPLAGGASAPDAPAPAGNAPAGAQPVSGQPSAPARPAYWDTPLVAPPEPEDKPPAPPPAKPEGHFWSDVKQTIGAGIERLGAAVEEGYGSGKLHDAQVEYYRITVLPEAVRRAQQQGIALTDDPDVIEAAKHVGLRPDQFASKWPQFVNMSEDDRQKRLGELQPIMDTGRGYASEGAQRRREAGAVEQDIESGYQDKPVQRFALHTASTAPDILAGLGIGMIPGGQVPAAAFFVSDFGLRAYSSGRDAGLNDQQAKLYGAISGAVAVAPEVPVMSVLSKAPGGSQILESVFSKAIAESTAGKVAGVANAQGLAMVTQTALQQQIDRGMLDEHLSLGDALKQLGESYLQGAAIGAPLGAAHLGVNRLANGPAPKPGAAPTSSSDALNIVNAQEGAAPPGGPPSGGSPGEPRGPVVEVDSEQAEVQAQQLARRIAAELGGDELDQQVAAIHANAHVAGVHDAAAVHQARAEVDALTASRAAEAQGQDIGEDLIRGRIQAGANEPLPTDIAPAMTPAQENAARIINERRAARVADKAATERAATLQDEHFEPLSASAEEAPAATAPKPTLGEALPPEQVSALQALRDRIAAQKTAAPAEEKPALAAKREAAKAQAPGGEEAPTAAIAAERGERPAEVLTEAAAPPKREPANALAEKRAATGAPEVKPEASPHRMAAIRAAAEKARPRKAEAPALEGKPAVEARTAEPAEEAEQPETNPPPATPKTLAERRQAGLDAKMAAKIRGEQPATVPAETVASSKVEPPAAPAEEVLAPATRADKQEAEAEPEEKPQTLAEKRAQRKNQFADSAARLRADDVAHTRTADGTHIAVSPNGRTSARELPSGDLQVKSSSTLRERRGLGEGTARLEKLAQVAHDRGGRLQSDNRVSAPAADAYRRLAERGYHVETRPHEVNAQGERVSAAPEKGVFSVGERNLENIPGPQLKRLVHEGDPAARAELDRRLRPEIAEPAGAAGEPTGAETPPQWIARNRETGDETARYDNETDAKDHRDLFPEDEVRQENALAAKRSLSRDSSGAARTTPRITKEQATQHLKPLIDRVGADKLQVHDGLQDPEVPQHIRDDAEAFNHPDPRGVYDPKAGTLRIFAGASGHTDLDSLRSSAVHEMAHHGVRSFLGDDYSKVMQDIYDHIHNRESPLDSELAGKTDKVTAREWLADYMQQHDLDPKNPRHQQLAADEYGAHLAVHDYRDENPHLLQRIFSAVRAGLRKLGIVREWSDNDIRRLLRNSNNDVALESDKARAARERQGNGLRWADSEDPSVDALPADSPEAIAARYSRVLAESANHSRGYVVSRADALDHYKQAMFRDSAEAAGERPQEDLPYKRAIAKGAPKTFAEKRKAVADMARRFGLSFVPPANIPDHLNKTHLPAAHELFDRIKDMTARNRELGAKADALRADWNAWAEKRPNNAARLDDLIHMATRAQVDPTNFKNRFPKAHEPPTGELTPKQAATRARQLKLDADRKKYYDTVLRPLYDALDDKGRQLYKDIRDSYVEARRLEMAAFEKRAGDLGLDAASVKNLMQTLRAKFESGRIDPYAPLMRFGDYFGIAKHPDGSIASFSKFESETERDAWLADRAKEGYLTRGGKDLGNESTRAVAGDVDPRFVADVEKILSTIENPEQKNTLMEAIWQRFLEGLPDTSFRKQSMVREGTPGFSGDARRAFSVYHTRANKVIARLEHEHVVDQTFNKFVEQAKDLQDKAIKDKSLRNESLWANAAVQTMRSKLKTIKNPWHSDAADKLTSFGAQWYLGANLGTYARISMQTPMAAYSFLQARHGAPAAVKELVSAVAQFAKKKFYGGELKDVLRGDERKAFDELTNRGVFQNLSTHSLTAAARGDPVFTGNDPTAMQKKLAAAAKFSQAGFNYIENLNRQSTALAAYRMARGKGMLDADGTYRKLTHAEAVAYAEKASRETHFDYSEENRPLAISNPIGKVLGLFQSFKINQLYYLARAARDGFLPNMNRTALEKKIARREVYGKLRMLAYLTGVGGVGSPIFGLINQLAGDKDNPVDSKALTEEYLSDRFSPYAAHVIMHGLPAAVGLNLSSLSYWDLAYRPPTRAESGREWYQNLLTGLAGPLADIPMNWIEGGSDLLKGEKLRALEHFLPPALSNPVKAARYATQGVRSPLSLEGNAIVPKGKLNPAELAAQVVGLPPETVADAYGIHNSALNQEAAIRQRGRDIMSKITHAVDAGDSAAEAAAEEEYRAFIEAHPLMRTEPEMNIPSAVRGAERRAATSQYGVPGSKLINDPSVQAVIPKGER